MIAVLFGPRNIPADSVRRAVATVFARPEYEWAPTTKPLHWLRHLWNGFVDWLGRLDSQHPLLYQVVFWAAVLVLIALLAHLGYTAWRIYRSTVATPTGPAQRVRPPAGGADQQLARAEALAREGRYTEALAHRFLGLLFQLDRLQALRFHPAKTPAEYMREAKLGAAGRVSFAELVAALYTHVFGAVPCDAQGYREFGAAAGTVVQHAASH